MPIQQTPGRWFQYQSATINPTQSIQIFAVPQGYQFRMSFLLMGTLVTPVAGGTLYIATDGVPIMLVEPGTFTKEYIFTNPLILTQTMIIGSFGTLGGITSYLVAYDGQMVKYGT